MNQEVEKFKYIKHEDKKLHHIYLSMLQFGFSNFFQSLIPTAREAFIGKNVWRRLFNIVGRFFTLLSNGIYYKFKFSEKRDYSKIIGKPCLLVTSQNNKDILSILKQKIPTSVYLAYEAYTTEKEDVVPLLHFPIWIRLYKFPWVWWRCYLEYGKKAWDYIDYVFKGVGYYESALNFLKKYRPEYIVFANDHSIFPRAFLLAAKTLKIPTIYIQHASVTSNFPSLDFDLNLLEGQATLDQYKLNGPVSGETKFVGMPKFDPYVNYRNTNKKVKSIGICSNKMDEASDVEAFLKNLRKSLPSDISITFRPHPGDSTKFDVPQNVKVSTKKEHVFDFLQKQDLIIASNTSIHLEAILLNVASIYYEYTPFGKKVRDMYSYCKNKLTCHAVDMEHLLELIKKEISEKDTEVYKKAKYYNAVLGTENEGQSGALAVQYINEFIGNFNISH